MKLPINIKQGLSIILVMLFIGTMMTACKNGKAIPSEKPTESHAEKEEPAEGLELSKAQMQAVSIQIGNIEHKNLSAVVKASGKLEVPPQNKAQVNVLSGGVIFRINVIEGQKVSKGQIIAIIENQDLLKIQQDYLSAKNGFTYVEAEYNRQKQLKDAGAGTGKSFQLSQANYNSELSRIKALERQLQQLGISAKQIATGNLTSQYPITSPIKGTIGTISAQTGSYAQPGTSLMDIVDNSNIHADLIVYEKDLSKIRIGQKVNFQLTNQDNQLIEGKIYGINKSFENDSKGVVVHAIINKTGRNLIPGMYVTGLINVGTELLTVVPLDAVVKAEGKEYIFVVEESSEKKHEAHSESDEEKEAEEATHFKKVEVVTGVSELGYIQITPLEKLPENVQIVTKGAFYLQSKSMGSAEEE
ncbi:efflux RND transporter periplasmic adaptor subunit [Pedobacter nutrimenti]|uniref:Cobalt-zinc-cadmium efflux system membrane fusion protein n=1 Tax=Pedobacter nutrimenti TaxID=1241337 RepID=A0A318UHV7_9SPHI|nr:efflux RND transporter periplasmic adaptor subunit [Pedobacter nutrimenti]PYF74638.1 cobalt-zinc-cadmium efflux system membrane fusion protein [Pedobacter nutrimenti]